MCEFCVKHGEGKKWYLAMQNYSRELSEQENRIEYMAEFANTFEKRIPRRLRQLDALCTSSLRGVARPLLKQYQKKVHYGQVVPIEEIEQILLQMDKIIRLPCVCRRVTTGKKEVRYCYALTADPRLAEMLDSSFSLEFLEPQQAVEAIRNLDADGLIHTVWTFKTPYIGAICNCDQDCLAYRICHSRAYFPIMFRGESLASVDPAECNGCKNCLRQCQFGAIRFSAANRKVEIDPRRCYGCGVCRPACSRHAITMTQRSTDPIAARIW